MKFLIIIDAQVDFVTGSLANREAQNRVPRIVEKVKAAKEDSNVTILYTLDTHTSDYLKTLEGEKLPIPHCIKGTEGYELVPELKELLPEFGKITKPTFGSMDLSNSLFHYNFYREEIEEIEICGFVTSICVVSNALLLRAALPNTRIKVDASCCAGLTKEDHEAAKTVMRCCQIDIVGED